MDGELKKIRADIASCETSIEQETQKLQVDKKAEREELQRKISEAKALHEGLQGRVREVNENLRESLDLQKRLEAEMKTVDDGVRDAKRAMDNCSQELHRLDNERHSQLDTFGHNVQSLVERIRGSQWYGDQPIGPLGAYVTLMDPKWRPLLQSVLGNMVTAFAITDARDRNNLKKILTDTRK